MPRTGIAERPRLAATETPKFRSAEEEIAYLRERVRSKEAQLELRESEIETNRVAKREIAAYSRTPAKEVLHENFKVDEHEIMRHVLKLEPEPHDTQIEQLLKIVQTHGIRNALSVAERLKNPHIEDDLHRMLVAYVAEGLPNKGIAVSEKIRYGLELVLFEIFPQAYGEGKQDQARQVKLQELLASSEQLYAGLMALIGRHEGFSLEIAVPDGSEEASLFLAVPRTKLTLAERLISSVFPNARINECRGDYNIFNAQGEHSGAYGYLDNHPAYPLKTPDMFEHDPLNVLLASFSKLAKHGEGAALQIVVSSEGERYNDHYKHILHALQKGAGDRALKIAETAIGRSLQSLGRELISPRSDKEKEFALRAGADKVMQEEIERKIKSRIAPVLIRLVTSAPSKKRADELLSNLKAPFAQYDDPRGNAIKFSDVGWWNLQSFLRDFTYRSYDHAQAMPLSLAELTSIFHFTAEKVTTSRELKRSFAKQTPAPVMSEATEGITLGINRYGATSTPVKFAASDRLRHAYVIGQTGTGKTTLLKNMIAQDIRNGEGVAFIDPHGNDIEDILASVPPERLDDVIYFDPAYTARPMGLNMLEYDVNRPEMKTFVVDEVYGIFRKLYADVPEAFGPMFEQYYRNSVQLVVEDPSSGSTFLEVPRILSDKAFRELKLSRCNNPVIAQFWRKIAEQAGGDAALENVVPYITSKFDVFLANDIMRPIVAQEKSAFDFRKIMDDKKIFLANLSKGRLGDRNTSLLGLVLVSKFLQAAFSRVDSRADYPTFYLYIDEFQNFATPSISTILSEARKYKLSLTIAHQFIAQLDEKIRDAVIGNVGTKASFRIGTQDAEFLEKQFTPVFNAPDLENLPNYNAVMALLVNGIPARPFTIETEIPPKRDYSRIDEMRHMSYERYGRAREEVEEEIRLRYQEAPKESKEELENPFAAYL